MSDTTPLVTKKTRVPHCSEKSLSRDSSDPLTLSSILESFLFTTKFFDDGGLPVSPNMSTSFLWLPGHLLCLPRRPWWRMHAYWHLLSIFTDIVHRVIPCRLDFLLSLSAIFPVLHHDKPPSSDHVGRKARHDSVWYILRSRPEVWGSMWHLLLTCKVTS